jgi:hypothetical protein
MSLCYSRFRKQPLKKNRNLESYSFTLKDEHGHALRLPGPEIKAEDLVPLIPRSAFKPVQIDDKTYWTFTPRIPSLGKVRLVFVAYSLLHLDCLLATDPKALIPDKTIGEACRQQVQALIEALILYTHDRLSNGVDVLELLSDLFAPQQPVKSHTT